MFDEAIAPAEEEKRGLRRLSRAAGAALLLVCLLQILASLAIVYLPRPQGMSDAVWLSLVSVLSGLTIFPGALLGRKLAGPATYTPPRKKAGPAECAMLTAAGIAVCLLGNLASALAQQLAGRAGIEFQGAPQEIVPDNLPGLLLMLLCIALAPAVTEELLMRWALLPPLRRYGDSFAVLCTAALFALLHQNMEQAPMAFVSGIALGWVYIRSGRIGVPVAVHLWNNAVSVLLLYLPRWLGEDTATLVSNRYVLAMIALGLLCGILLYMHSAARPAREKPLCVLPPGRRAVHYFLGSPAMVLSLLYFAVLIVLNTEIL